MHHRTETVEAFEQFVPKLIAKAKKSEEDWDCDDGKLIYLFIYIQSCINCFRTNAHLSLSCR